MPAPTRVATLTKSSSPASRIGKIRPIRASLTISELPQVVAEVLLAVLRSDQTPSLELRRQTVGHVVDVRAGHRVLTEQEAVTADLFHDLAHPRCDLVRRTGHAGKRRLRDEVQRHLSQ